MEAISAERCVESGKICYSYNQAHNLSNKAKRSKGHGKKPIRCYHCNTCGNWHLTSQKKSSVKEVYDGGRK